MLAFYDIAPVKAISYTPLPKHSGLGFPSARPKFYQRHSEDRTVLLHKRNTWKIFCLLKIKHTILVYWRNQGQAFRLAVKTLVKIPAPHTGAPGFKTPLQLLIPASCYEDWEAGITAQVTGILPPTGEAWNEFLASSWTSPTCCRHLGSDPPDGSSVSLTLKLKK